MLVPLLIVANLWLKAAEREHGNDGENGNQEPAHAVSSDISLIGEAG